MPATHHGWAFAPAMIRDDVMRFGPDEQLTGIVSRPERPAPAAPGVMILNAGVLHRIGPHRLHTILARRLAELGMSTLRLDLGGIGDSVASSDAPTFRESAVADTRLAMDFDGARRTIIFGICAGADNALATALVDDRVAGIVLVDPHVYASRRAQLRHLRKRLTTLGGPREIVRWGARLVERNLRARLERLRGKPAAQPEGREPPPIEDFQMQLGALVERGVKILAIYSGVHEVRYNHADQLFEVFPELRGRVDRAYFPHANHTFTELEAQGELIATVSNWITSRFA